MSAPITPGLGHLTINIYPLQTNLMMKRKIFLGLALALFTLPSLEAQHKRTYIELDGERQYLSVPAHTDFDMSREGSYTISYWFWGARTQAYTSGQRILSRASFAVANEYPRFGYELLALRNTQSNFSGYSLQQYLDRETNRSSTAWVHSPERAEIRSWHHVAFVIDREGGQISLYVDAQLQSSVPAKAFEAFEVQGSQPVLIGCSRDAKGNPSGYFGGRLDNVRFYHRALTIGEVKRDLSSVYSRPKIKGLVAAFDFDSYRPGDTSITDATGRHTAQLHGFASGLDHPLVRTFAETKTNGNLIGRGEAQALSSLALGLARVDRIRELSVSLEGTTSLEDIRALKLYATEVGDRFDHRSPGLLIAQTNKIETLSRLIAVKGSPRIDHGTKLWLVADIAPSAGEGNLVATQVKSISFASKAKKPFVPEAQVHRQEIVLERTLVWTPGEQGAASYRIPAIVRMDDGSLVVSIDRRKNSDYDLPEDIDVEVKISHDEGKTWSEPITVARGTAAHGYGDAAMVSDGKTIHMVMVAGSGLWAYPSSAQKAMEMYYTQSTDGGRSWTPVREITSEVYTDRYPNGGFFGSGNGLITSRGRIAFVAAMRVDPRWGGQMDNVMVYSDDQGKSWKASPVARANGDESKIVELSSGELLISSRNRAGGANDRTFVVSADHGQTWSTPGTWRELRGNACNASLTRYSTTREGKAHNVLLHTLLHSAKRERLTLFLSDDDGRSWPVSRVICEGEAAYSELVVFPDGSIGIISEENDRPAYDIYFTRVSLEWLMKGKNKK